MTRTEKVVITAIIIIAMIMTGSVGYGVYVIRKAGGINIHQILVEAGKEFNHIKNEINKGE